MSGTVRSIPDPNRSDDFLYIETDGQLTRIDASANPSALGGKFDLASTPGRGTRAVITLAKLQES